LEWREYLIIIPQQDRSYALFLSLALLFRKFCEEKGQLQYRIPSKEELEEKYLVRDDSFVPM
jgi:hypothetical protein